ncbi:hypothetical protein B0H66DRAFT_5154 [Apodospora peruviana]|uniref:Transmembrane protein n=1 Tax=Apodospora peruviana TaxID=516989 RepID=A0AAE0IPP0_9PEZI|nr:hypothetical protein B0H66DRAFT_5154 [Apodospora peruviana]
MILDLLSRNHLHMPFISSYTPAEYLVPPTPSLMYLSYITLNVSLPPSISHVFLWCLCLYLLFLVGKQHSDQNGLDGNRKIFLVLGIVRGSHCFGLVIGVSFLLVFATSSRCLVLRLGSTVIMNECNRHIFYLTGLPHP